MDLNQLRTFLAIAESGKMSLAADRLFMSQPALSRRISQLEKELDVHLFERKGRRLKLSGAGEFLLQWARKMIDDLDQTVLQIQQVKAGTLGIVRVAAGPTAMRHFVAPATIELLALAPDAHIELLEDDYEAAVSRVQQGDVELAIVPLLPDMKGLSWETLYDAGIYAVVNASHHLVSKSYVTVDELYGERLLLRKSLKATQVLHEMAFHVTGFRSFRIFESFNMETLYDLAQAGYGIALRSDAIPFEGYALRSIPLWNNGRHVHVHVVIARRHNHEISALTGRFIEILKQIVVAYRCHE